MSDTIIQVENLGKKYFLKHRPSERYIALRDVIARSAVSLGRRLFHLSKKSPSGAVDEEFWALRDVGFGVEQGEIVGIIGRNGAGKSTLLKIISRITEPTTGRLRIKGRVASLLEVGTGFHPELTGRENIFLNGAILGMSKVEIKRKFDEIVAFAEVEKFLDTPIKRFSSGMYVRLAFAVAAHLEPEILLVDEVLAVGDAQFRRKCLGKMGAVASEGRTVLFVSHNLAAINRLCNRCILLDRGQIQLVGNTEPVISRYLSQGEDASGLSQPEAGDKNIAVIHKVGILDDGGRFSADVGADKDFYFWIEYTIYQKLEMAQIAVAVLSIDGNVVFVTANIDTIENEDYTLHPGPYRARIRVPGNFLNVGAYSVNVRIFGQTSGQARRSLASAFHALTFRVEETGSVASKLADRRRGVVTPILEWRIE